MLVETAGIGATGFRACGIYPFNPLAIPEHAYAIANNAAAICAQASGRSNSSKPEQPYTNNTNRFIRYPWDIDIRFNYTSTWTSTMYAT
jgi:hypothetical protein